MKYFHSDQIHPSVQILFFHSWINEYARVSSVTKVGERNKVSDYYF